MPNELYHYGILGQKWGVRRFQNPDGTLTKEGAKRYRKELRSDKSEAYARGKEATVVGEAYARASKAHSKAIEKASKATMYDPEGFKKSTRRASEKELLAGKVEDRLKQLNDESLRSARSHVEELRNKYGRENVTDLKTHVVRAGFKDIEVANERAGDAVAVVGAALGTAASAALTVALKLPVVWLFRPVGTREQGASYYRQIRSEIKAGG